MGKLRPSVLVIGCDRTGTSNTARILHEKLGVCMGHLVHNYNQGNPKGFYEDAHMHPITMRLATRPDAVSVEDWIDHYDKAHRKYGCEKVETIKGLKNTHLTELSREQLLAIRPWLIVRTWRPKQLAVRSMRYYRGGREPFEKTNSMYDRREWNMIDVLSGWTHCPVVCIRYDREQSDEEIVDLLRPYLEGL